MTPIKQEKHNSLIDIYKLFFSSIILYYHNCFIIPHSFSFSVTNEAVCFFFLISGYYMYTACDKFLELHKDDKHFLLKFIWYKLKKLGFPTLISYIASVLDTFTTGEFLTGFMHYLWYIHIMIIIECIYLILLKYLKVKTINIIIVSTMILAIILYIFIDQMPAEIKGFIFIPLGYLISCIDIKRNKNIVKIIYTILFTVLIFLISTNESNEWIKIVYMFIILPLLFYFIVSIDSISFKASSVIARFSLCMYVYQSFVRWLGTTAFTTKWFSGNVGAFLFIMFMSLLSISIEHSVILYKKKKLTNKTV